VAEEPAWQRGGSAVPVGMVSPGEPMLISWPQPRPRVVVRADLLPALGVSALIALLGVPVGWVWSRLAPPERLRVLPNASLVPLNSESYHRFDDLALFALICLGVGVVVAVGVWLLRQRRGPVVLLAAVAGAALGAWLAMRTGTFFAGGHYPLGPLPSVGSVVLRGPRLESGWAILPEPLAVAFIYGTLVAWNGMDDLGRRLR
jgi:hypothetical protein